MRDIRKNLHASVDVKMASEFKERANKARKQRQVETERLLASM